LYICDLNWEQSKLNINKMEDYSLNQVVVFALPEKSPITCTIRGVHHYQEKVKYDLELWLNEEGNEVFTRIYNVDSKYVYPI